MNEDSEKRKAKEVLRDYGVGDLSLVDGIRELIAENGRLRSGTPVPQVQHERIVADRDRWVLIAARAEEREEDLIAEIKRIASHLDAAIGDAKPSE